MKGTHVLVAEDEPAIGDALAYSLRREGARVELVSTASEALRRARAEPPDVLLLDIMLPDGSGVDVCRELRAESDVPIIMLTARGSEVDRVLGLEVGADDYVVKPFSIAELVSRIRALLRRRALDRNEPRTVTAGDLTLDLLRQEASVGGRPVPLTPAELRLVAHLARQPGRAFTRDELMAVLWGEQFAGASRACDTHVLNLRRKLGRTSARIETVRGVGYRLSVA